MDENFSVIAMVVDRSGSMCSVRNDTIGGINTFFDKQKEELAGRKVKVTVAMFDDKYEVPFDFVNLKKIPKFGLRDFEPRGMTALLDAIGITIDKLGRKLSKMKEYNRPSKVVVSILTDGYENSSREYTRERIAEMIQRQENQYNWDIMFLGAGLDSVQVAQSFGFKGNHSMVYDTAKMNTVFCSAAASTCRGIKGLDASYTSAERLANAHGTPDPQLTVQTTVTTSTKSKKKSLSKRSK